MERCPFCGCKAIKIITQPPFLITDCYAECTGCRARGPNVTHFMLVDEELEEKAEVLWNGRNDDMP